MKDTLEVLVISMVKIDLDEIETKEELSEVDKRQLKSKINKSGLYCLKKVANLPREYKNRDHRICL